MLLQFVVRRWKWSFDIDETDYGSCLDVGRGGSVVVWVDLLVVVVVVGLVDLLLAFVVVVDCILGLSVVRS